ncbi:AarF/ABC1/UbiB kinase family protein [Roseofilum sp. BLCC_M154]|uniref:AarF/ABC1/UbiB kinase family protein n=1 Tax=Roseofilum acuticapitatum BLCC-M154 TaxID=3022444 RepID=A0ABT7AY03_9CYAN|nr:AarF/ABC1/UbiB kinase family protein [Roseofilum acuticapitatum]MDJ1170948.1 AarF/ABC1/UbiB kinase family protein [Roseofilum acuticapitatum BLCC-M154]
MLKITQPSSLRRWQKLTYSPVIRQIQIFLAAFRFITLLLWDRWRGGPSSALKRKRARGLVQTLLKLGPTFIKIGQSLSTRADLLPVEYVEALEQLQDQVPAFEVQTAIAIIELELGASVGAIFRDFDPLPLAAASLGQVHRATLHTQEEVVIKVQRPGLKALFDVDAKAIYRAIQVTEFMFAWTRKYELRTIYSEFFRILYQEIDYKQEGLNADRFRQNFAKDPKIIVPRIYWRYTTHKVLTIEYLPGIKVDNRAALIACGLDPQKINQIGICCYLKQLLLDGFFQADPHPGNLAVTSKGQLIFYDFGMMGEIQSLAKDQMIRNFFAVLRKDTDEVVETLINMGLIEPMADMTPVRRLIAFLLDRFTERPVNFREFTLIKDELYAMFEQQPFRLPAEMTFVLKALTTLDGIARILDPEYNFAASSQPFIREVTAGKGTGYLVGETLRQVKLWVQSPFEKSKVTDEFLEQLGKRMDGGDLMFSVRAKESDRLLESLSLGLQSLLYLCGAGFTLISSTILFVGQFSAWAIALLCGSGLFTVFCLRSLFRLSLRNRLNRIS